MLFPRHINAHTHSLTLFPVFLSTFFLPLRIHYNFPSSRKSSLIPLQTVLYPSASHSLLSCLGWRVTSFFDGLPSNERAGSLVYISENPAPGMLQFTEHPQVHPLSQSITLPKSQQGWDNYPIPAERTEAAGGVVPARPGPHWPD